MAGVVTKVGSRLDLDKILANGNTWRYRLYKNNVTPTIDSTGATFTEATFPGYAEKTAVAFPAAAIGLDNRAFSTAPSQTYVRNVTGAQELIYGYYVLDGGGNLLWAEKFGAAVAMTANGDFLTIVPTRKNGDRVAT